MNRITISSSLRFKSLVRETIDEFETLGITALFPNMESGIQKDQLTAESMKKILEKQFMAIDESDAVYVINPEGYIGIMVTAEIGYALGKGKPVYYSEKTYSAELDSMATGFVALDELNDFLDF